MIFKLLKNKEKTQEKTVLKNQKTKEKSRGRSMVEMLGVLAIIGVLSIGGIQGYTMAMRKHKANEILNALEKQAMSYYSAMHQKMLNDEVIVGDGGYWQLNQKVTSSWPYLAHEKISGIDDFYFQGIKSSNSGDFVLFDMSVNDKQLCETLANTTGDKIDNGEQCFSYYGSLYYLYLSFLMN